LRCRWISDQERVFLLPFDITDHLEISINVAIVDIMDSIRELVYRSNKKRRILFQAPDLVITKLDEIGKIYGIARSELLREAVMQLLEREIPVATQVRQKRL